MSNALAKAVRWCILKSRRIYVNMKRDELGKKKPKFGKIWGTMTKEQANTRAVKTGDGLWVLDLDSKDMKVYPKKLRNLLPKHPTVETANGYHYYFKGEGIPQTQKLIELVDVRNEGGVVFDKYWGDDEGIAYKRKGDPTRPSPELLKYLKSLHGTTVKRKGKILDVNYVPGKPWKQFADGEQHDMLVATVSKMREEGNTRDEIQSRYQDYIDTYLHDRPARHERGLMLGALDWAEKHINVKLSKMKGKRTLSTEVTATSVKKKSSKGLKGFRKAFSKIALDDEAVAKRRAQTYIGLFGTGMVTVLFGAAGTFKTTVMARDCVDALKADSDLEVYMWSFDAAQSHENAIIELAKAEGVADRFHISNGVSSSDYNEMVDHVIGTEEDMRNTMFIVDTYKHVSSNVNDKSSNLEALTRMKQLGKLGCTVVTLAHSNKDKDKNSGTAEVEQDSDALLKIDATEVDGTYTISITKFGRVRYDFEPCSYEVAKPGKGRGYYDIMKSVKKLDKVVDIEREAKNTEAVERDRDKLEDVCRVMYANEGTNIKQLLSLVDTFTTRTPLVNFLNRWDGKAWEAEYDDDEIGRSKVYHLNPEFVIREGLFELGA